MFKIIIKEPLTWVLAALFLFVMTMCTAGIAGANKAQDAFENDCKRKGGQVIVLRRDSLCTSADGRIIGDL